MTSDDFASAVTELKDRVHTYAVWMLQDLEFAADAVQEAYTRLWEQRDSVHPAAARAWLLRAVHRLCVDQLRVRNRRPCRSAPLDVLVSGNGDTSGEAAASRETREAVCVALASLAPLAGNRCRGHGENKR